MNQEVISAALGVWGLAQSMSLQWTVAMALRKYPNLVSCHGENVSPGVDEGKTLLVFLGKEWSLFRATP